MGMMTTRKWAAPLLLAVPALLLLAPSASAVTFDFATWADVNGEKGFDNSSPFSLTVGAVTVTATAFKQVGNELVDANVYLDEPTYTPERPAGMGVCSTGLNASLHCIVSEDDNVTSGEMLTLTFGAPVVIGDMTFRDADHWPLDDGKMWYRVDGGDWEKYDFGDPWADLSGTTFDFKYKNTQFYISTLEAETVVPEPATLGLLGAGLLGLVARARRRRS